MDYADPMLWAALGLVLCVAGLSVYDRFYRPLPWWRKIRVAVYGFSVGLLLFSWLRKKPTDPKKQAEVIEPPEYDDAPAHELDTTAADADLQHRSTDRRADDNRKSIDELGAELDDL